MTAVVYLGREGGYIRQTLEDHDYAFDLPLPPRPRPDATPVFSVTTPMPETAAAPVGITPFPPHDPTGMRVVIPLTGATPLSRAYGALIAVGWSDPSGAEAAKVHRLRVTIDRLAREDGPLGSPGGPTFFRRLVLFVGVNGRWHRQDITQGEARIDFVTELNLHEEDEIHITATGFVTREIFDLMGVESGVAHALTSETSGEDDAKNAAEEVAKVFARPSAPFLGDPNDAIVLFARKHRPAEARPQPFVQRAREHVAPFERRDPERISYTLEYRVEQR
jgi:hypothetical protein